MKILQKLTMEEIARLPEPCKRHRFVTTALYDDDTPAIKVCVVCRYTKPFPPNNQTP